MVNAQNRDVKISEWIENCYLDIADYSQKQDYTNIEKIVLCLSEIIQK